jgi:hypothetical protein
LAILAAASIDAGASDGVISAGLAGNACASTRKRLASRLRDRFAALLAFVEAVADRHEGACELHGIRNGVVDLILHSAISRPTTSHISNFPEVCPMT